MTFLVVVDHPFYPGVFYTETLEEAQRICVSERDRLFDLAGGKEVKLTIASLIKMDIFPSFY